MADNTQIIILLAIATLTIRLSGLFIGQRLPQTGPWANGLKALPGCLLVSLVTVMFTKGSFDEWVGGALALITALLTRSLILTMLVGIVAVWFLRFMG